MPSLLCALLRGKRLSVVHPDHPADIIYRAASLERFRNAKHRKVLAETQEERPVDSGKAVLQSTNLRKARL